MKLEDLKQQSELIQQQFNNLSNHEWISNQLNQLKGKFEILSQVIASLEAEPLKEEENATDPAPKK